VFIKPYFVVLLCSVALFSQSLIPESSSTQQNGLFNDVERESPKYQTSMEKYYKNRSLLRTIAPQILEQELDAETYDVGPGDQFAIFIYGELEVTFDFAVMPEGYVYIPTIGKIDLKNLTLKTAKEKIVAKAKELYINADISVNLISLRKFRVYLVGEVVQPGAYFVQGSNRVSDVLEISGGTGDWADLSAVEVKSADGTVKSYNILKFYKEGKSEDNAFIKGGDVINVKSIDLSKPYVIVESQIEKILESKESLGATEEKTSVRKIYRLHDGENVYTFLHRISAYSANKDLTKISLVRRAKSTNINVLGEAEKAKKIQLENNDIIIIPNLVNKVYVQGEVYRPGAYEFDVNLTANDYAGMAGVWERAKPSEDIIIIRRETGEVLKGGETIIHKGDTIIVPRKLREDVRGYMTILLPILTLGFTVYSVLSSQ
jgi:protein involved in polysaccharide export with SLBB domain